MDLKIQAKSLEHIYHVVMQKPFQAEVPFFPQKKAYEGFKISQRLPRKMPEDVDVSSKHLANFLRELESTHALNVHQVMVVKDNTVICEAAFNPYRLEFWHVTHSLCKTVTAMAVGILVEDGRLSTEDKLVKIFEKQMSPITKLKMSKLNVKHLLTMSSGATVNESVICSESDWLKAYLDTNLHFEPGSKFQYNSINSYVLSCIVQEITGMTMFDFLKERLFTPMGIETVQWESCPMGHTKGGWGMYLLPEDMAKLGLLLLQNGTWKGKSLVPADYVAEMTKKQIDSANDEDMFGYGFQTWMGKRPGSFLFNGMLGQNVHVIPDRSMVIVVTGGNDKLFGNCEVNRIIYKYFTDNALPVPTGNKNDYRRLCGVEQMVKNEYACLKPQRMNSVLSALQKMKGKSAIPQDATALGGKSYTLDALNVRFQPLFAQLLSNCYTEGIDRISFMLEGGKFYFLFKEGEIENKIAVGFQNHEYTKISIGGEPYLVAAQGVFAVDEDDTPVLKLAIPFVEHSNGRLIKIFFLDDENIKIEWREFPGKTIIADGAQTLLSSLNDSIMNQVKSRIDIDMLLSMADGIMEPISTGKLLKH